MKQHVSMKQRAEIKRQTGPRLGAGSPPRMRSGSWPGCTMPSVRFKGPCNAPCWMTQAKAKTARIAVAEVPEAA